MRVIVLRPGRTKPEGPKNKLTVEQVSTARVSIAQCTFPLIDVALVSNPGYRMKIEARRFDPKIHRRVLPSPPSTRRGPRRERPDFSAEPDTELLTWTVAKLRTLPEYLFVHKPSDDKSELVKQILKIRERR